METREIGYISKTHGLKGHLILRVNDDLFLNEEKVTSLFLELNGSQVPFFIEEIRPNNVGYILKLETIDTIENSKTKVGKKVFSLTDFIEDNASEYSGWIGYEVIDQNHGNIGVLKNVDDTTQNILLNVVHPSGIEIMLPFNEDLLEEINDETKSIHYNAPEGLLDMYLSK